LKKRKNTLNKEGKSKGVDVSFIPLKTKVRWMRLVTTVTPLVAFFSLSGKGSLQGNRCSLNGLGIDFSDEFALMA
jgi:hypothetical protein